MRFIIEGRGLFHINAGDSVFVLEVGRGDLIRVPRGTHHWFDLCADKRIRAIRLFQNPSGWTPHYTESGVDRGFQPLCFGPSLRRALRAAALVRSGAIFSLRAAGIDVVLLDIEGTTTPISFVHDVLFPYARARVRSVSRGDRRFRSPRSGTSSRHLQAELPASGFQLPADEPSAGSRNSRRAATSEPRDADIVSLRPLADGSRSQVGSAQSPAGTHLGTGLRHRSIEGRGVPRCSRRLRPVDGRRRPDRDLLLGQRPRAETALRELDGWRSVPVPQRYFDTGVGAKGEAGSYRRIVEALQVPPSRVLSSRTSLRSSTPRARLAFRRCSCVRPPAPAPAVGHSRHRGELRLDRRITRNVTSDCACRLVSRIMRVIRTLFRGASMKDLAPHTIELESEKVQFLQEMSTKYGSRTSARPCGAW